MNTIFKLVLVLVAFLSFSTQAQASTGAALGALPQIMAATGIALAVGIRKAGRIVAEVVKVALPILNQRAEKEMLKQLRHEHTWVAEIPSKQSWVNQDAIRVPKRGAAPRVLIDNTQYPITKNRREDSHIIMSLNKFDTENTVVTDDELYALPYDKTSDVQVQHRETLEDETLEYGLYGLAPTGKDEDENLFILETTGEDDGTGRKKLRTKDLRTLQEKMNKKGISKKGRILLLCDEHVSDLLNEDKKFNVQYHNHKEGAIVSNYYGFKIYEESLTPEYNDSLEKLPYQSADVGRKSSVVFHKRATAKAKGSVKRYAIDSSLSPDYRESTVGFRMYHVIVAYGVEGAAAIVSGKAA